MNTRLLISLSFVIALTACGGAEERKSVYMEKAQASIEAGNLDKARIELKNVLQIDPKDARAYFELGKLFEELKEYRKAYSHYLKAEELDPDILENQARLGRFYLLMNETEDADAKIDYILSKEPENSDGLLLKATKLFKDGHESEAVEVAKQINTRDPSHVQTAVFLSTLYLKEKKTQSAVDTLAGAVDSHENNSKLNSLYALALMRNNQNDKAENIFKSFIEKSSKSSEGYNNLSAFYHQIGAIDKAKRTLSQSIEQDPDDAERHLTYIKYINHNEGHDAAINELKESIANYPSIGKLRIAIGELYVTKGQLAESKAAFRNAINDFSEESTGIDARIALASIHIKGRELDKAREVIDDAYEISPNDSKVNFIKAKLAIQDNDLEQAIIALRIVTKEDPENVEAHLLLAGSYKELGNIEQQKEAIRRAHDLNKLNGPGLLQLAKYQISNDIAHAEQIIDDYNSLVDKDYNGLSMKAALLNQKKEYSQAGEVAQTLIDVYPGKPNGYIQSVTQYTSIGQVEKAESVLEKGYLNTEDNRKILVLLTSIQVSQKKFDVVENRIKAELKATPDDPALLGLLANVYSAQGDNQASIETLNKIIDINPKIQDSYLFISQIHEKEGNLTDAITVLKQGEIHIPESVKLQIRLATIYEKSGKHTDALNVYRKLHEKAPDNVIIANNLASLLSDYGTEEDLSLARNIVNKLKDAEQSVFLDTVGWVHFKSGDYQRALSYLERAVDKSPDVNIFHYHLGMAYKATGQIEKSRIHLEKSLELGDEFKHKEEAQAALNDM